MKETTYLEVITRLFNDSGILVTHDVLNAFLNEAKKEKARRVHLINWENCAHDSWDTWKNFEAKNSTYWINRLLLIHLLWLLLGSRYQACYIYELTSYFFSIKRPDSEQILIDCSDLLSLL